MDQVWKGGRYMIYIDGIVCLVINGNPLLLLEIATTQRSPRSSALRLCSLNARGLYVSIFQSLPFSMPYISFHARRHTWSVNHYHLSLALSRSAHKNRKTRKRRLCRESSAKSVVTGIWTVSHGDDKMMYRRSNSTTLVIKLCFNALAVHFVDDNRDFE